MLDASVALAWHFDFQSNESTTAILHTVVDEGAIVPSHWALELSNALQLAMRTEHTTRPEADGFMRMLDEAPIEMDMLTHSRAGRETLDLAIEHGLTTYDAAYLELARRKDLPLATRDRALAKAARNAGLKTIEP